MFVCSDCCRSLCKDTFDKCWIKFIGAKSVGPCEECGQMAVCVDCLVPIRSKEAEKDA